MNLGLKDKTAVVSGSTAGIGLAITRTIAEAHGGALVASNRSEGGAFFRLSLPFQPEPDRV